MPRRRSHKIPETPYARVMRFLDLKFSAPHNSEVNIIKLRDTDNIDPVEVLLENLAIAELKDSFLLLSDSELGRKQLVLRFNIASKNGKRRLASLFNLHATHRFRLKIRTLKITNFKIFCPLLFNILRQLNSLDHVELPQLVRNEEPTAYTFGLIITEILLETNRNRLRSLTNLTLKRLWAVPKALISRVCLMSLYYPEKGYQQISFRFISQEANEINRALPVKLEYAGHWPGNNLYKNRLRAIFPRISECSLNILWNRNHPTGLGFVNLFREIQLAFPNLKQMEIRCSWKSHTATEPKKNTAIAEALGMSKLRDIHDALGRIAKAYSWFKYGLVKTTLCLKSANAKERDPNEILTRIISDLSGTPWTFQGNTLRLQTNMTTQTSIITELTVKHSH